MDSLRLFEIELNRTCFTHRWWPFCHKFIQDLLLGGAWPSHFIHSSSPQKYSESGLDAEKKNFSLVFSVMQIFRRFVDSGGGG